MGEYTKQGTPLIGGCGSNRIRNKDVIGQMRKDCTDGVTIV
jgi:hypothetical protein